MTQGACDGDHSLAPFSKVSDQTSPVPLSCGGERQSAYDKKSDRRLKSGETRDAGGRRSGSVSRLHPCQNRKRRKAQAAGAVMARREYCVIPRGVQLPRPRRRSHAESPGSFLGQVTSPSALLLVHVRERDRHRFRSWAPFSRFSGLHMVHSIKTDESRVGQISGTTINAVARNPGQRGQLFTYAILGFCSSRGYVTFLYPEFRGLISWWMLFMSDLRALCDATSIVHRTRRGGLDVIYLTRSAMHSQVQVEDGQGKGFCGRVGLVLCRCGQATPHDDELTVRRVKYEVQVVLINKA